jgi:hypothetical protein
MWGSGGIAPPFSTSALDGGESPSRPGRFTHREIAPRHPLDMRLIVPQNRYGRYGEEKNLATAGNRTWPVQRVARRYTD